MKFILKVIVFLGSKNYIHISDEKFLKLAYKLVFDKKLDLNNPKTFNEKIQWLKINNRKDIYTIMVDKYAVKKYVADKIGKQYIIPTLGVYDSFEEIDFEKLPNQFVLKCTHDSGGLAICKDKKNFDYGLAKKILNKHLKTDCYMLGREWPYKNVNRKIIAEKFMADSNQKHGLIDYKFHCFNGEPKFLYVSEGLENHETAKMCYLNMDFSLAPFQRKDFVNFNSIPKKPNNYDEMKDIARKLSKDIPMVRVDLYEINNKVYFSELTLFPGGGFIKLYPEKYDKIIGEWLKIK